MPRIVLSYSRKDQSFTNELVERLSQVYPDGQVWYDIQIPGGEEWKRVIAEQIEDCDVFLFILSLNSITSQYCRYELHAAQRKKKPIIPLLIQPLEQISAALDQWMKRADESQQQTGRAIRSELDMLSNLQMIDLTAGLDAEGNYNKTLRAISFHQQRRARKAPESSGCRRDIILLVAVVMVILFGGGVVINNFTDNSITNTINNVFTYVTNILSGTNPTPMPPEVPVTALPTGNGSLPVRTSPAPAPGCVGIAYGGAPTAGTLDTAAAEACFTFVGSAGEKIKIRTAVTDRGLALLRTVYAPDGEKVCDGSIASDEMTCDLTADGSHRILVRAFSSTDTGAFNLSLRRLSAPPTACTPVAFGGAPTAGALDTAAAEACFTFVGSAGKKIKIRTAVTDRGLALLRTVYAPDGEKVCDGSIASDEMTCDLTADGSYTILVRAHTGTDTGVFNLVLATLN